MQPPVVRTLDQLVTDTNSVYDPKRAANATSVNNANVRLGEQQQGLDAAKTNAFGDITQTSTRRGALFSGFAPDAQAHYIGEKYLPALANLRAANEQTIQGINNDTMNLDAEQRKQALATREGDLSQLYDYNKTQSDRKFQTDQANQAYEREMAKLRQEQAFTASQNAQNRAASAPKNPTTADYAASMGAKLQQLWGSDNFVSPTTWAQQKSAWLAQGQSAADFDKTFAGFKNPKNPYYK